MKRLSTIAWSAAVALLMIGIVLFVGQNSTAVTRSVLAAKTAAPTITGSDPAAAPNDLDSAITITGDNFENGITATLGSTALQNVVWISATRLTATVPWGMSPGVYTLNVRMMGYAPQNVEGVTVSVNRTSNINVELTTEVLEGDVVVVQADRAAIKKDQTSSIRNVSNSGVSRPWSIIC